MTRLDLGRRLRALGTVAFAVAALLWLPAARGRAQAPGDDAPTPYTEDFRRLVALVERTHPAPYQAFGGPEAFRERAADFERRVSRSTSLRHFHTLCQHFLAGLGDAHTSMSPLPTPEAPERRWSPLRFGVAADGLYVRGAQPSLSGHVGGRVLAVEDLPVDAVLDSVRLYFPSENAYGALHRLRGLLSVSDASWPPFMRPEDGLRLALESPEGRETTLTVDFTASPPAIPAEPSRLDVSGDNGLLWGRVIGGPTHPVGYFAWNAVVSREVAEEAYRRDPETAGVPGGTFDWVFGHLPGAERTGSLEEELELMPSLYGRFSDLLETMESRGAEHLIIDLRRNSGGMTPLIYTLLYMLYGDAVLETEVEARYDVRVSDLYLSKIGLDDIDQYNARFGTDLALGDVRPGHMFRNDLSLPLEERRKAEGLTFGGFGRERWEPGKEGRGESPKVIVLTSSTTFSAAFHFAWLLSEVGSARVVGVPPRQAPNAFMESTPFELPGTGLRGSISNARQILRAEGDPRADVFRPDFPMSWEDFARYDFDPNAEILYALDLIEDGRVP